MTITRMPHSYLCEKTNCYPITGETSLVFGHFSRVDTGQSDTRLYFL